MTKYRQTKPELPDRLAAKIYLAHLAEREMSRSRTCPWCGAITDQCPSCERPAPEPAAQYDGAMPELTEETAT
jgi:hypothetical protein